MTAQDYAWRVAERIWSSTKEFGTSDKKHVALLIEHGIRAAILAERVACANIAEAIGRTHYAERSGKDDLSRNWFGGAASCAEDIAMDIRKRGQQ